MMTHDYDNDIDDNFSERVMAKSEISTKNDVLSNSRQGTNTYTYNPLFSFFSFFLQGSLSQ